MTKKLLILFLLLNLSVAQVDPFYIKLLEDGKKAYRAGKYDEAIENLKIAEFGLMEERELLREVYVYKALAYFKKKDLTTALQLLNKIKEEFGLKGEKQLKILYPELKEDIDLMFIALKLAPRSKNPKFSSSLSPSFQSIFQETIEALKKGNLEKAKKGLKALEKLNSKEPLTIYVKARIYFETGKFEDAAKLFRRLEKTYNFPLPNEVNYYLGESYFYLRDYIRAFHYLQRIDQNSDLKAKAEARLREINSLKNSTLKRLLTRFSPKEFERFLKTFPQDEVTLIEFVDDLKNRGRRKEALEAVEKCVKHLKFKTVNFYLKATEIYELNRKLKDAISLLEDVKRKFPATKEIIEVYYRLGELKFKKGDLKGALKEFKIVEKLNSDYKNLRKYLKLINKKK